MIMVTRLILEVEGRVNVVSYRSCGERSVIRVIKWKTEERVRRMHKEREP